MNEWSARRTGRYLHNAQQTQETNIHAFSGIRTRDTSNRAAADLSVRTHGHRNRLYKTRCYLLIAVDVLSPGYFPNRIKDVENEKNFRLLPTSKVWLTEPIITKLSLARQVFVKNTYTAFQYIDKKFIRW
jgi:hypothetical protein